VNIFIKDDEPVENVDKSDLRFLTPRENKNPACGGFAGREKENCQDVVWSVFRQLYASGISKVH
jgi:hypothetical protein